jgi:hypothetical protein
MHFTHYKFNLNTGDLSIHLNLNRVQRTITKTYTIFHYTVEILLFFSPETGESAQLRFALKNFGRNSPNLGEFRPLLSRKICCFGEIPPKSKEIRPKIWGRNLTARIRPFRARKIINRKFRVATEIGSTFFGCWSVDKKRNY